MGVALSTSSIVVKECMQHQLDGATRIKQIDQDILEKLAAPGSMLKMTSS